MGILIILSDISAFVAVSQPSNPLLIMLSSLTYPHNTKYIPGPVPMYDFSAFIIWYDLHWDLLHPQ